MQIMKQLSIKGLFLPAIALCSLLLSGNAAHAALVTYSFTGSVSQREWTVDAYRELMSPVSGTFEFDNSPAVGGNYPGVVSNLVLNIGGYTSTYAVGCQYSDGVQGDRSGWRHTRGSLAVGHCGHWFCDQWLFSVPVRFKSGSRGEPVCQYRHAESTQLRFS